MKSLPRQCFSMFPPACLHDSADCSNYYPDRPPLMVTYSHVAINDKLEVKKLKGIVKKYGRRNYMYH